MDRKPPAEIRRALRSEVGFGCPIADCGSPYLEWHHFDPPWRERQHHEQSGMIALCSDHHSKADAGAYTKDQLRTFKANLNRNEVEGRFDWLRHRMLAVVGGCFYYETLIIFEYQRSPMIWFRRDDDGYLLLNLKMLTKSDEERLLIEDNFWIAKGLPVDFECPPSGRLIHGKYSNGDEVRIEFFELATASEASKQYPGAQVENWPIEFPITAVEVQNQIGGTGLGFGARWTRMPGFQLTDCFSSYSRCGISLS
jgi:hypothetical protein